MEQKLREHCREFDHYFEYCLLDDFEKKYSHFKIHSVQLGDVFVAILETKGKEVLVSLQFFKDRFSLMRIGTWIDEMGVYLGEKSCATVTVPHAKRIVDGLQFKGRPVVLYEKGQQSLNHDVRGWYEVTDVFHAIDWIVQADNAKEVEMASPCKAKIYYHGERVTFVPRIEFDLSRDRIISNGQLIVADYIDDYCGTVGFWQKDNAALPVAFFYDDETPIYIDVQMRPSGSKVCVIEQKYVVSYDEL